LEVFGLARAPAVTSRCQKALRLSPRDTQAYVWMTNVGIAKNQVASWEQAVAWFRRSIEANRNYPLTYFQLAAALAKLGRLDEARSAAKARLALNPTFAISHILALWSAMSENPTYLAQTEAILEGMRKAGVPEE
jgi:tetratricopeptide (TPR) repeat protein